jgi:SAM-dependent methyltransferase
VPAIEEVFACPACGATEVGEDSDEYVCVACARRYPIIRGIPRFVGQLEPGPAQVQRVFDFEHRRYRDSAYTRFSPTLVDDFLTDNELPRELFSGARALDVGCGSGRWTYALSELGADVIGCDLTEGGLESAFEELGGRASVTLVQADIFRLPFRSQSFDFVMSWGVLHHTPDTLAAFEKLVPLVRPGGILYVMVYERHSLVRRIGTGALRAVLRRMSDERRYAACRRLVIRRPLVYKALVPFLMVAPYDETSDVDLRTLQFGLFDAYSPRYNHLHSREEVIGWFEDRGFSDVTVIETPAGTTVKVRGTKR